MVWFSDHFYWRPAKGKYDSSIHLYIEDGWRIRLDMDDCNGVTYMDCECERCGYDSALSKLTIEELKELRDAMTKAIEFYEEERKK